jgi:hypothetical protein
MNEQVATVQHRNAQGSGRTGFIALLCKQAGRDDKTGVSRSACISSKFVGEVSQSGDCVDGL